MLSAWFRELAVRRGGEHRTPALKGWPRRIYRLSYRPEVVPARKRLWPILCGEPAGTRTQNPCLKRAVLYLLSYRPTCVYAKTTARLSAAADELCATALMQNYTRNAAGVN